MAMPFPFSAIVAQEEMKRALLLAAIDPSIGGVLIFGDRGTGKSTAVRALAALLPPMRAVVGDPYNRAPDPLAKGEKTHLVPVPVVDLPLGATEDRVVGALDLEKALVSGEKAFQPGLLARAHRGFLYIDEANLLEDHLVDVLLDVAASGENVVEREGLSIRHPARFVLVGSGNPEEGELRPQLLDRFGLSVEVTTPTDLPTRIEVVKRRDAFDRDPQGFTALWRAKDEALGRKLTAGRKRLPGLVDLRRRSPPRRRTLPASRDGRAARRTHLDPRRPRPCRAGGQGGGAGQPYPQRRADGPAPPPAPQPPRRSPLDPARRPRPGRGVRAVTPQEAAEMPSLWRRAELAIALLALDPAALGGVTLRAPAGPVREALLALLAELMATRPLRRLPASISDARLLGGLDLAATLACGRPVAERGLLAEVDGGVLVAAMSERMSPDLAARLAAVLDTGDIAASRQGSGPSPRSHFGILALDEGESADERPPAALTDRLALMLDLTSLSHRDIAPQGITAEDLAVARAQHSAVGDR